MPLVGRDGPAVLISAETAALLDSLPDVRKLRMRMRGRNPAVSQELLDLRDAAMRYAPSLSQNAQHESPITKAAPELETGSLLVAEVADLLGVSPQAVTAACRDGRLIAEQVGPRGDWHITREAFREYKRSRNGGST